MPSLNAQQTLAQARDAWNTRFRAAYLSGNGGFVAVAFMLAAFIGLAASGDLADAATLAVCFGWTLAMPLVLAAPAYAIAGPYPSAIEFPEQMLAAVSVDLDEHADGVEVGPGSDTRGRH